MIEIDDNTKYSLRLLGRGSLIVVSLALILALIGYYQRNESKVKSNPEMSASELVRLEKDQLAGLVDKTISITSNQDSLHVEHMLVQIFPPESKKLIEGLLKEPIGEVEMESHEKIYLTGTFVGFSDGIYRMKNCSLE